MNAGQLLALAPPAQLVREVAGGDTIEIVLDGWISRDDARRLTEVGDVRSVQLTDEGLKVVTPQPEADEPAIRRYLEGTGATVTSVTRVQPSMDETFVRLIDAANKRREMAA
jgi:hypothetical protein